MNSKDLGDYAFYLATAMTVLFSLLYLFSAPWWQTSAGRNIMSVMGSVAIAFSYFSWAIAVGGIPPGFDGMRALLFILIALSVTWRTVIFIRHHLLRSLRGQTPEKQGGSNELEDVR